jgi:cobalamin transport system substrate-binding protein
MNRRRFVATTLAVLGLVAAAAGCSSSQPDSTGTPGPSAASYPVTVGGVTLAKQPTRIISLSPTATEMLFAIDAGPQVVAVDDQSNYPASAPRSTLSGFKPNAEAIASHNPDLVVVQDDPSKVVEALTTLKIPVYVTSAARSMDDAYAQIDALGTLTGHPAQAATLARQIRDNLATIIAGVAKRTTPLTYYIELSPDYYTATSTTFIGSLVGQLGLSNIADTLDTTNSGYPQLHAETIITADPDLILLDDTKCCGQTAGTVAARAGWGKLTAVVHNQVVPLDDDVASRWGPRVVDLLRAVADAVARIPAT